MLFATFLSKNVYVYLQPLLRNAAEFCEKKEKMGHFAVQGHSKSPILVPIESSYTTSY